MVGWLLYALPSLNMISIEAGLAGGLTYTNNLAPAVPVGLLGLLLLFQVVINQNELPNEWRS